MKPARALEIVLAVLVGTAAPLQAHDIAFTTTEVTWPSADLSPDGGMILFDLLGDVYALDPAGGKARPLLTGIPYDVQPTFSPDGKNIAFISDRAGPENLWIADRDGRNARRLSGDRDGNPIYSSPCWSPDGRTIYVSRMIYGVLAFEIWAYDVASGEGRKITKAQPLGTETQEDRKQALGAAISPDGHYLYYAVKSGTTWTRRKLPHWQIMRRDLKNDVEEPFIRSQGGAMQPVLSRDGSKMVYATREGARTALRLRDLSNGNDRLLIAQVDPDGQEGGYYSGLLPRISFTPDDRHLLLGLNGGLKQLDLADGMVRDIPFEADVRLGEVPQLRSQHKVDTGPVHVRIAQQPRLSPDGRQVVFGAAGGLYVMERESGRIRQLRVDGPAWQPGWSADGGSIVYVTWAARDGGHIWVMPSKGDGRPRRVSAQAAFYTEPAFTVDGREIVALRSNHGDRLATPTESDPSRPTDIVRIQMGGDGTARLVASRYGARDLQVTATGQARFYAAGWLETVALAGGEVTRVARIVTRPGNQYFDAPAPVQNARLSPDGAHALVRSASQLLLLPIPRQGADASPPVLHIDDAAIGARRLTAIGADYFDWAADGRSLLWSLGTRFRHLSPSDALAIGERQAEARAPGMALDIVLPRDRVTGDIVLRGAKVVTMRGDEIIERADILVSGDRIAAIGPEGQLALPAGARLMDMSGKVIVPGFVDVHAHWFETRRGVLDIGHWDFAANLAYGVTSGLDVQSFDPDIFTYADMIDAGMMAGPRVFSTGPGIFRNADIRSRQDAIAVLTRYRDYYRTPNIKQYMTGNRAQRRFLIEAAAELGLMPTTEGASDWRLDITQMLDGYPANEHALPIAPLHDDVMQMLVRTRISYSPTMMVLYGAPPALDDMALRHADDIDAKLRRLMPGNIIALRVGAPDRIEPERKGYPRFAAQAIAIQRAGGLLGVGSHGALQGLGYHWELEALASGGATPMEVLRAATIGSAEVIGRAIDIGSIEVGKFADLLVLDSDPTVDITNSKSLRWVMKGGRLYDAATLDEYWPRRRKATSFWFDAAGKADRP